jgi:phytoene dehydrogenase-like protein
MKRNRSGTNLRGGLLFVLLGCLGLGFRLPAEPPATNHWAYRPLGSPRPPAVADKPTRNPVDAFIRAKLSAAGLPPAPEADRRTLLRRVCFDLTGLPPTPEELRAFVADTSTNAYETVVERLLASPRHGERWARHWMDAAHFAETHGHDQDRIRTNAWPYRDWLIGAFNTDKPFARFVQEQVAGDVLVPDDPQATVALGFHRVFMAKLSLGKTGRKTRRKVHAQ